MNRSQFDPPLAADPTTDLVRLTLPSEPQRLDLQQLFGNPHPVELEIGTGRGRFLLLASHRHPEVNYLGLEYARKYWNDAVDRIGKRGLTNVRLIHTEALAFMRACLPDRSIHTLHLYFPDPWPKKRHHKRRFVRPEVLSELARVIRVGGQLRIATDHTDYALWIEHELDLHPSWERVGQVEPARFWDQFGDEHTVASGVTNFEIKYRREGRAFRMMIANVRVT
jgi:tRNA (guanine-N7-)-methyltransferase